MPTAEVALRIRILKADTANDTRTRDLLLARAMRSSEVLARTPILVLVRAAASDGDATPRPSALPAQARTRRPLARTDPGRAFLTAAADGPYAVPTVSSTLGSESLQCKTLSGHFVEHAVGDQRAQVRVAGGQIEVQKAVVVKIAK